MSFRAGQIRLLWLITVSLVSLGSFVSCSSDPAADADPVAEITDGPEVCEGPVSLAALPDDLYEASGIIRDPRREDLFWVHNDSGNASEIYGIDLSGKVVVVVPVSGVPVRDLEDIAI